MFAFGILAILVLLSALAVVLLPNPLHSALCLALNLVAVAGIYALLGAHFLAAVQVIVYAGAIMVLVVFVLMLLNIKSEQKTFADLLYSLSAIAVAGLLGYWAFPIINHEFQNKMILNTALTNTTNEIGIRLFSDQAFLFQLTGIILITAIVGAVMLASQRGKRIVTEVDDVIGGNSADIR